SLSKADREGRLRERIRFLCRSSLLIIDEIGYLTVGAGAGNLFFQLVNARYERGAMILTSNRGFGEWGEVSAIRSSQRPCWTDFCTMPWSFRLKVPATACANMPTLCRRRCVPSRRPGRSPTHHVAVA